MNNIALNMTEKKEKDLKQRSQNYMIRFRLRQTAQDQEVLGSNPGTLYWWDIRDTTSYYINIHKK
jgi:hypothetical protein